MQSTCLPVISKTKACQGERGTEVKSDGDIVGVDSRSQNADTDDGKKKEALLVASMGHGLDGHPGLAHGGTIATLFDEGLSLGALQVLDKAFMTAHSFIKYKAAVPTPSE